MEERYEPDNRISGIVPDFYAYGSTRRAQESVAYGS